MAITQPTYPTRTDDLVTYVGSYIDTQDTAVKASAVGAAVHNGTSYPARPSGYASVMWIGPDDPAGSASNGDTWVDTTP
jgi:hypothetical protein